MEKSLKVKQRRLLRRKYGNRKYRKRIKMMHRQFTMSSEFAGRQEPYRTLNLAYARAGASLAGMAKAEHVFHVGMAEIVKASKHWMTPSGASNKEEQ